MKVLLTGAAGRLGRPTIQALINRKHRVVATDRIYRKTLGNEYVVADLTDLDKAYALLQSVDAVVHLANHPHATDPDLCATYHNNTTVNANITQAAAELGLKRIVYASSITVATGHRLAGPTQTPSALPYLPLDGAMPPNPATPYALSKLAGEQALEMVCKHRGMTGIALRLPYLVGDDQLAAMKQARFDTPPPGTPLDEGFSYLTYADAAALMAACLEAKLTGYRCYLPATTDNFMKLPVDKIVTDYFGGVPLNGSLPAQSLVDISRVTADTGWQPKSTIV